MSVFAGGWTLEAAEAVCAEEGGAEGDLLDPLAGLVAKSLVQVDDGGEAPRYRLLEAVRLYAAERLAETGEAATTRARHLAWCAALAEEARPHLAGPEQGRWLARLEAEHDNLRAALGRARDYGAAGAADTLTLGIRLARSMGEFWDVRGHLAEGRRWLESLLDLPAAVGVEPALRGRVLSEAGLLAWRQGDLARAEASFGESLAIGRDQGGHVSHCHRAREPWDSCRKPARCRTGEGSR